MSYLLLVLLVLVGGLVGYVRFSPNEPGAWHADPLQVTERGADNSFLAAPGGDVAPCIWRSRPIRWPRVSKRSPPPGPAPRQ